MSISDELKYLDATALAELVREKEVKPIELVEDAIERIEKLNPTLNAVITPMYELARDAAKSKLPDGPFTGVPFLLKDILASYGGVPLTMGSKIMRQYVPDHDSEIVRRYKKAGLIIVGKTNLCEFGLLPTTEPEEFGATKNPWNLKRTSGGSSGGSAAAVASRMVTMAYAVDGGGSIRIPASCCGVFGLKPTRGRISMAPDHGDIMGGFVNEHAITISVRDSAALLDATAGCLQGDPYWAPPVDRPFIKEVGADAGKLRIAYLSKPLVPESPVHEDCLKAAKDAALLCESLGHIIEDVSPATDWNAGGLAFLVKFLANTSLVIKMLGLSQEHFEKYTWVLNEMAKSYDAADYLIAEQTIQRSSREIALFFEKYDIWITPTLAQPPLPFGRFDMPPDNPDKALELSQPFTAFTAICNGTGQPAMSVPLYWNAEGLPIGTHFIGRFGDEAMLFRLAAQLEAARPWKDRRPPLCA
jgi:amidase